MWLFWGSPTPVSSNTSVFLFPSPWYQLFLPWLLIESVSSISLVGFSYDWMCVCVWERDFDSKVLHIQSVYNKITRNKAKVRLQPETHCDSPLLSNVNHHLCGTSHVKIPWTGRNSGKINTEKVSFYSFFHLLKIMEACKVAEIKLCPCSTFVFITVNFWFNSTQFHPPIHSTQTSWWIYHSLTYTACNENQAGPSWPCQAMTGRVIVECNFSHTGLFPC